MKKETLTEKLIKRTYGISGPLDEHKQREADRIGNKSLWFSSTSWFLAISFPLSLLINIPTWSLSDIQSLFFWFLWLVLSMFPLKLKRLVLLLLTLKC